MSPELSFLIKAYHDQRLPHAVTLSCSDAMVTLEAARHLAKLVLCLEPTKDSACGKCHSCQLFDSESHPDAVMLAGEGKTTTIKVDQVREVTSFLHETASVSPYRVVIIEQAQNMNVNAANALLKSLEEPGDNTLLLLTCQNAHVLLPTIRSRCQHIYFTAAMSANMSGALIDAIKSKQSPLQIAKEFEGQPVLALDTIAQLIQSVLGAQQGLKTPINFPPHQLNPDAAFSLIDKCFNLKWAISQKISLNMTLMMEDIIIDTYRVLRGEAYVVNFVRA